MMATKIQKYKIVVVGASGVGKTTMVRRLRKGEWTDKHVPTLGVEVTPVPYRYMNDELLATLNLRLENKEVKEEILQEEDEVEDVEKKEDVEIIQEEDEVEDDEEVEDKDEKQILEEKLSKRIMFNVWDCAGDKRFLGLEHGYWHGADAFIVMFDVTKKESLKEAQTYIKRVRRFVSDGMGTEVPILLIGNKVDVPHKEWEVNPNTGFQRVSYKSCHNFDQPFLSLLCTLLNDTSIYFP